MAKVQLDVEGTEKGAQALLDKSTKKVAELTEKIRTMNRESTKGAKESESSFAGVAAQLVSVGAVTGLVMRGYSAWRTETDHLAQAHKDLQTNITKTLAEAGKLGNEPQVQKWLASLKGVTPEQGRAALSGVMKS